MFSAINALRFSNLSATPAATPGVRFAAMNDSFTSVRFGDGPEVTNKDEALEALEVTQDAAATQSEAVDNYISPDEIEENEKQ